MRALRSPLVPVCLLLAACGTARGGTAPAAPPAPAPEPGAAPETSPLPQPALVTTRRCVVEGGELRMKEESFDPIRGDTVLHVDAWEGHAAPTPYAAQAAWYVNNEAITFANRRYVKLGIPRTLPPAALARAGEYRGVSVFVEKETTGRPAVLYLPVHRGCEFQAYHLQVITG